MNQVLTTGQLISQERPLLTRFISWMCKTVVPAYSFAVGNAVSPGIHSPLAKLLSCQEDRDILPKTPAPLGKSWGNIANICFHDSSCKRPDHKPDTSGKKTDNTKCGPGSGAVGSHVPCWRDESGESNFGREHGVFCETKQMPAPGQANLSLDLDLTDVHTWAHQDACVRMFTIAFFVKAKNWKLPKSPSMGEWIDTMPCSSVKQKDDSYPSGKWQSQDLSPEPCS